MLLSMLIFGTLAGAGLQTAEPAHRWIVYWEGQGEVRRYREDMLNRSDGRISVMESVLPANGAGREYQAFLSIDCSNRTYRVYATHVIQDGREISHALTAQQDSPIRPDEPLARLADRFCTGSGDAAAGGQPEE